MNNTQMKLRTNFNNLCDKLIKNVYRKHFSFFQFMSLKWCSIIQSTTFRNSHNKYLNCNIWPKDWNQLSLSGFSLKLIDILFLSYIFWISIYVCVYKRVCVLIEWIKIRSNLLFICALRMSPSHAIRCWCVGKV